MDFPNKAHDLQALSL